MCNSDTLAKTGTDPRVSHKAAERPHAALASNDPVTTGPGLLTQPAVTADPRPYHGRYGVDPEGLARSSSLAPSWSMPALPMPSWGGGGGAVLVVGHATPDTCLRETRRCLVVALNLILYRWPGAH